MRKMLVIFQDATLDNESVTVSFENSVMPLLVKKIEISFSDNCTENECFQIRNAFGLYDKCRKCDRKSN